MTVPQRSSLHTSPAKTLTHPVGLLWDPEGLRWEVQALLLHLEVPQGMVVHPQVPHNINSLAALGLPDPSLTTRVTGCVCMLHSTHGVFLEQQCREVLMLCGVQTYTIGVRTEVQLICLMVEAHDQ